MMTSSSVLQEILNLIITTEVVRVLQIKVKNLSRFNLLQFVLNIYVPITIDLSSYINYSIRKKLTFSYIFRGN